MLPVCFSIPLPHKVGGEPWGGGDLARGQGVPPARGWRIECVLKQRGKVKAACCKEGLREQIIFPSFPLLFIPFFLLPSRDRLQPLARDLILNPRKLQLLQWVVPWSAPGDRRVESRGGSRCSMCGSGCAPGVLGCS